MSNEPENTLAATSLPVSDLLRLPDEKSVSESSDDPTGRSDRSDRDDGSGRNGGVRGGSSGGGGGMLRSNVVVALGTATSRLTGLIRVYVFARVVGQAAIADAYNSADGAPNAIYELLLGGVLSASLIPMFTKQHEDDDEEATSAVFSVAMIAIVALTLVAVLAAPLVFRIFSVKVDAATDADVYRAAGTALTRIFLLEIFFYGLTALGTALLNARRRFFAAAWAPVLSNVVIIAGLAIVPHVVDGRPNVGQILTDSGLRWTLSLATTVGIASMAVVIVVALRRADVPLRFNPNFRHPAIGQLTRLSVWTFGYVAFNQIAAITMFNLADPGTGRLDAYLKAYILFVLPHGLLAMSIATTFEPEMARNVKRRDRDGLIGVTSLGIRLVALLTFPAGVLLFVLRRPIVGLALQHGNFTGQNALETSRALGGFALGLVGFSVYLFTLRAFYAHGDARTPFIINTGENMINIVLGIALHGRFGVLGLGLAFAIAYLLAASLAIRVLGNKVPGFPVRAVVVALGRMAVGALVLAEVTWFVAREVGGNTGFGAAARLAVAATAGLACYVGVLSVVRAPEIEQLTGRVRRINGRA